MRKIITTGIAAFGLLLTTTGAYAQYGRDRNERYPQYGRSDRGGYQREPLDRVRADLDRAARDLRYLSGGEMRRFNKVREEIAEFQNKWERGRFDRHELDDVIGSLQRVVDRNRLEPRDRDLLQDDANRLRDVRARYTGGQGYRY